MYAEAIKEDIRIRKTRKALYAALHDLLKRHRFKKITVHMICRESQISKTAFYAHYTDKYDLLDHWLAGMRSKLFQILRNSGALQTEEVVSEFLREHYAVITNLMYEPEYEQKKMIYRFLSPDTEKNGQEREAIRSDFIAGALYHVINSRLVRCKNVDKLEPRPIIRYVSGMIKDVLKDDYGMQTQTL